MDYSKHISKVSQARNPSASKFIVCLRIIVFRKLTYFSHGYSSCFDALHEQQGNCKIIDYKKNFFTHTCQISLGAGQPNPSTFPFASMTVTLKTGEKIEIEDSLFNRSLSYDLTVSFSCSEGESLD
jgi:kynurenine/2-aminoadipate aminotransferase